MMRIAKDVEDELKEEDNDGEKRNVKRGGYDKVGQSDWVGLLSNRNELGRSFKKGGANPNQKSNS